MGDEDIVDLSDSNFQTEAIGSAQPVIVDLWAPWCGPCKMLTPIIEEIAKEYRGKLKVGKLNVDDSPQTATRYNIVSIPTILFIKNGTIADQHVGLLAKNQLKNKIDLFLA
jgi:thioredoxin 1